MAVWSKEQCISVAAFGILGASLAVSAASYFSRFWSNDTRSSSQTRPTTVAVSALSLSAVAHGISWLSPSVLGIAGAWALAIDKSWLMAKIPAFFSSYGNITQHIPIHPQSLNDAFRLGQLFLKAKANLTLESDILAEVSAIVGRSASMADLLALEKDIPMLDDNRGVVSRVLGAFNLINIVWGISILGLSALIGPVLWLLLKPVRRLLTQLWTSVILPALIRMKPLYPYLLNLIAVGFMTEAHRYPMDTYSMAGVMMAITGLTAFLSGWSLSTVLHSTTSGDLEAFSSVTGILLTLVSGPLAMGLQSKLLGYVTVVSGLSALGFSFWSSQLCLVLGFRERNPMVRTAITCLALNLLNVGSRAFDVPSPYLAPFSSAIATFGSSVYFLALLISTNAYDQGRSNVMYVSSLVAWIASGELLGLPAMSNVAKVYGSLFAINVYGRNPPRDDVARLLWMFGGFGGLYAFSLYMNRHPELLTTLYAN